ncbi:hypothetical protein [Aureimonas pseudogalii]|uniref:Uncharacterized protein n=1 Tax=Aureimonas pseudogalii TaxID=1744844 RepID=A0A7W6H4V0_9HYPH|nr:hypothetical protein [Aureimonas pseudogalii]MBB3998404.1 hypothetical protein [Aureimonas pseudogalii]
MSIAPEAFEWLRAQAYERWGRMPKAERQAGEIAAWGASALTHWREGRPDGGDLSDAQLGRTANDVARYMVERYGQKRSRPAPRTTAEGRAVEKRIISAVVPDYLEEIGQPVTAKAVAQHLDVSERKASRALATGRGAPKRDARVAALDGHGRILHEIAEALLPVDGFCVLRASDIAARLWSDPAETDAARRKRRERLLKAFAPLALLSFHVVAKGDLLALRRGRKWKPEDAAARLAAAAEKPGRVAPLPVPRDKGLFWESAEVRGLIATLRVSLRGGDRPDVFEDFLAIQRLVHDGRAVMGIYHFAHRISGSINHWCNDLPSFFALAAVGKWGIRTEPTVSHALSEIGCRITMLEEDGCWGRSAFDTVQTLLSFESRGVAFIECFDDDARARIEAFQAIVDVSDADGWIDGSTALKLCDRLAREERDGTWSADSWIKYGAPF